MAAVGPDRQIELRDVHFAYGDGADAGAVGGSATSTADAEAGAAAPEPAGTEALCGVTLSIRAGEHVCIVGGNGSGKSTLVQLMNALLVPAAGTVEVFGLDTAAPERAVEIRRQAAMVFQHPDDQLVANIVADDVAFGPENLGLPQPEIARRVDEALAAVGMSEQRRADPAALSGGQKQRVAIAGALAMEPRALLLDEPSAMLDTEGRRAIQRIISQLNAQGITIVHVTHFMDDALRAGRVVVLEKGRVALDGPPAEVFAHRELLHRLGLELPFSMQLAEDLAPRGFALPVTASADELAAALSDSMRPVLIESPELDATRTGPFESRDGDAEPAIAFEDVCFSYEDAQNARKRQRRRLLPRTGPRREPPLALDHVSFEVPKGQLTALVGHTGSGKSTSVELACALKVPRSGRVRVAGIDTADLNRRRELRGLVGYVSQLPERQLFAETILDDVSFGPRNLGLAPEEVRARAVEALAAVGLPAGEEFLARSPFALSGGQQRGVALAGVIAMRQPILVLDEPMAGLDPQGRARMRDLLRRLKARGTTLVLVTHSMDDVAELADRVVTLEHGRVLAQGTPREVFAPAGVRGTRGGAPTSAALGEPQALSFARTLAAHGVELDPAPLTRAKLVEEVGAHGPARA